MTPRWRFWKKYPPRQKPELELDLRYPIGLKSNFADGIYSGHTLEHLNPDDALNLLKELFRILKSSCWLRINVPDLEKYINYYIGKEVHSEFFKFPTGCEAIRSLTQNHGHNSVWDEKTLKDALKNVGFINIKKVEFGKEGNDKRLIKEEEIRRWETIVMEAQKS